MPWILYNTVESFNLDEPNFRGLWFCLHIRGDVISWTSQFSFSVGDSYMYLRKLWQETTCYICPKEKHISDEYIFRKLYCPGSWNELIFFKSEAKKKDLIFKRKRWKENCDNVCMTRLAYIKTCDGYLICKLFFYWNSWIGFTI